MRLWGFEARVAYRHLRYGGGQTVLTVATVATGVVVVVFICSLIFGLRSQITEMLTDILPHVTVSPVELKPYAMSSVGSVETLPRVERQNPQRKDITNWHELTSAIEKLPHVVAVAPAIVEQGFVSHGGKQLGAIVYGAEPSQLDRVTRVRKYIMAGRYDGLASGEIVVTYKLTKELGVNIGDHVRLMSNQGVSESLKIVGVYDSGNDEDYYRLYITLRQAQSLYRSGTGVRSLLVKSDNLFNADKVADEIAAITPHKVESWSRLYPQSVSMLNMMTASAIVISVFSLIAAGFAIASVLVVSVLQKGKQIGILKSIGAHPKQIFRVFLLEGVGIAIVGSSLGAALGIGIVLALGVFKQPTTRPDIAPERMFPAELTVVLIGTAMLAAIISTIVAAAMPAKRAASLDPVQVMR